LKELQLQSNQLAIVHEATVAAMTELTVLDILQWYGCCAIYFRIFTKITSRGSIRFQDNGQMDTRKLLESLRKKQATAALRPGYVPYLNDGTDTTPEQLQKQATSLV